MKRQTISGGGSSHHRSPPPNSGNNSVVSGTDSNDPPFLPLEETMMKTNHTSNNGNSDGDFHTRSRRRGGHDGNNNNNNSSDYDNNISDYYDYHDDTTANATMSQTSSHSKQRSSTTTAMTAPLLSNDSSKTKAATTADAGSSSSSSSSTGHRAITQLPQRMLSTIPFPKIDGKKIVMTCLLGMFTWIIWESCFVRPEDRIIQPDFSDKFLAWVESNPVVGLGAILIVIAAAVVSMVPIGTPLVLGCGFIYRGVYGWKLGLFVSTVVSMAGSTLGAVVCFLLGRYLMRDTVKRWVRNYPLFDAIDVAASENGLKIMAMLYLTPVLPLGLVSYMCGTTSMALFDFAVAKIASLPLYLIYTFIGASAHSFIKRGSSTTASAEAANDGSTGGGGGSIGESVSNEAKKLEENQYLLVSGLVLSIVMMTLITRYIRKELMKILDQQKKDKTEDQTEPFSDDEGNDKTIELGLTSRRKATHTSKRIPVV